MSVPDDKQIRCSDGARAPAGAIVLASRLCPACQTPLSPRQRACSNRCRAARSRQGKVEVRRERDAEIRTLLEAALQRLREDP